MHACLPLSTVSRKIFDIPCLASLPSGSCLYSSSPLHPTASSPGAPIATSAQERDRPRDAQASDPPGTDWAPLLPFWGNTVALLSLSLWTQAFRDKKVRGWLVFWGCRWGCIGCRRFRPLHTFALDRGLQRAERDFAEIKIMVPLVVP